MTDASVITWRSPAASEGLAHGLVIAPPRKRPPQTAGSFWWGSACPPAHFFDTLEGVKAGRSDGAEDRGNSQLAVLAPPCPRRLGAAGNVPVSNSAGAGGPGRAVP